MFALPSGFSAQCAATSIGQPISQHYSSSTAFTSTSSMLHAASSANGGVGGDGGGGVLCAAPNSSGSHLVTYGNVPKQLSPMLDDTMAAAMHSNLFGGSDTSPLLMSDAPPGCWMDAMAASSQQDAAAAAAAAAQHHAQAAAANKSLQQQQQALLQAQHAQQQQQAAQLAAAAAAAAAADPNAVLYANYRSQHPAAYAEADRLRMSSDMSAQQQDMLAAELALKARQHAHLQQQQQQQLQQQQQQLLLAQMQQQHRQQNAASASALYSASTAPHSSNSTMSHQQLASTSYSQQQQQSSHNQTLGSNTTSARLPPRPTAAAHHYHPYNCTSGAAILEHHAAALDQARTHQHQHHQSLVAAAAAARAAALQQAAAAARGSSTSIMRQTASAAAAAAAAALQRSAQAGGGAAAAAPAGRWSGAVAVLDQGRMQIGAQESVNLGSIDPCGLECDEDLLSMDGCDAPSSSHQQRQQRDGSRAGATSSGNKAGVSGAAAAAAGAGRDVQQQQQQGRSHALVPGAGVAAQQQQVAAAAAAQRAAAAGYALNALEEDDQLFDMYEDSGSTHPDSDNQSDQSDDMDADTVPLNDQQPQQQQQQRRVAIAGSSAGQPEAGSSRGAAAAAAAASAEQGAATRQAVALRVLNSVACRRKGEQVLTAHPTVAAAAGAQSVRSRLLITEVSLYSDNAATSLLAMEQSNMLLAKMTLPDGITYMPVQPDSFLFKAAHAWQFPAFAICLGSSYLQRMLVKLPHLAQAALACPEFGDYCRYLHNPRRAIPQVSGEEAQAHTATLRSILFTCLFIATKVADQVHALGLLRFILTNLSHNGVVVTLQQAIDVEARCLEALDWRLGPFFVEDELADEDLELWAAAMGHWDYGTTADSALMGF